MRKQKEIWRQEHEKAAALPSLAGSQPSSAVVSFVEYLQARGIKPPLLAVDIGSGKGRHAIYLAKLGFEVYAMDYIQEAIEYGERQAKEQGLQDRIHFYNAAIDERWPFDDNFFDLAVDCFSSIDIETAKGREVYRDEMMRTLKPRGLAMVAVVSAADELELEMMQQSPGTEKNSVIWPENKKFQKDYDEAELREFYQGFNILELKELKKPSFKLGRHYTSTNFWLVLEKKSL